MNSSTEEILSEPGAIATGFRDRQAMRPQIFTTDQTAIFPNKAEAEPRASLVGSSERHSLSAHRAAEPRRRFGGRVVSIAGVVLLTSGILKKSNRSFRFLVLLLTAATLSLPAQQTQQNPSPMTDTTRPHPRIAQVEVPGRRVELKALKGAVLFAGPKVKTDKPAPLVVHFHGASWLVQHHVAASLPRAALITVQLGAGSRAYANPFENSDIFRSVIDEAKAELGLKHDWSSITLTGFSAGYGAVRAILRQEKNFARVNNVLLLDGIHAGYSPEGKLAADGGTVNAADLDSFVKFAGEAAAGKRSFVITHSEIFPGTYASTTECVDYLLGALGIKRKGQLKTGPMGMQQLSVADTKGLHIRGYAGNTAPDHVDHLHAMPEWFKLLDTE